MLDLAPAPVTATPRARQRRRRRRRWPGLLYLAPAVLLYTLFTVLPALHTAYLSFFNWDGVTLPSFAGPGNYRSVFADPQLRAAAEHAGTLILFFSVLPIALGLVCAAIVAGRRRRARRGAHAGDLCGRPGDHPAVPGAAVSLPRRLAAPAVLVIFLAAVFVPFLSLLSASIQPAGTQLTGLEAPHGLHLENFVTAWSKAGFGRLLLSSGLVAVAVVPASVLFATLAGYALATMEVPGAGKIFGYLLLGLALPAEVTVIPLYYDLRALGLTDTRYGLALVEIAAFMPFGTFWMRSHFATMPAGLIEAARLDGATSWSTLWRILLPNSRPAVTTLGVLYFVWCWNQFLLPLILIQDPAHRTAPAGLGYFTGEYNVDIPSLAAATLIVIAPVVVVYLFFQRHFIRGVLDGAIKG